MNVMAEFQNAVGFVFNGLHNNESIEKIGSASSLRDTTTRKKESITNSIFAHPEMLFSAFEGMKKVENGTEKLRGVRRSSFPLSLLRHLRAWHALPPLMQALLPAIASALNLEEPAAIFRLPFYDSANLLPFNYAALGQVIARALARNVEDMRRNHPEKGKIWQRFWDSIHIADSSATYCVEARRNENDTWRQRNLDHSNVTEEKILEHVLALRIAYIAFLRAGHVHPNSEFLAFSSSGLHLTSKQLFLIAHCATRCATRGSQEDHLPRPENRCMVVYKTSRPSFKRPCAQHFQGNGLNECHYI
ncbi:uncharacterized protein LOC144100312 [Amblyomma americanum]